MNPPDPKAIAGALKCQLHLIPSVSMEKTANVLALGANKYGEANWREPGKKIAANTYVSAILRHLNAWREGEDLDPESGITHLAHISATVAILMDAQAAGTFEDNRLKMPQPTQTTCTA